MKKTIAVAALFVASFAAPALPVQAASSYPAKCLVLPLLQSECRTVISNNISEAASATHAVASSSVSAARKAAGKIKWPAPLWLNCEPAPAGSGHLYDCD
ncbi:MAG: hypothetical protein Q8L54_09980 [Devosia sp.]|nr:hypothetical protein [Devosia sp.]